MSNSQPIAVAPNMPMMPLPLQQSAGHTASSPATQQHSASHGGRSPAEVGKSFEGMFVSMFIKQMRQALPGNGLFGKDPSDSLGGLFDHFMSTHIAQSGHLGIAKMIQKHLESRGAHP